MFRYSVRYMSRGRGALGVPEPAREASPGPWAGWNGDIAHPAAPAGGGGPGGFVTPGGEDADDVPSGTWHPGSPGVRLLDADDVVVAATGGGQNPPPATVPAKKAVLVRKSSAEDIDVHVEVIADGISGDSSMRGARTSFDSRGVRYSIPGSSYVVKGGKKIVTSLNGVFELKGTIPIQTVYGPSAKPTDRSLYGRGTTATDIANKDTSLGFHESCHREDYLDYLQNHPLPRFTGKVGQTVAEFEKASRAFEKAFKKYWKDMDDYSFRRTDEVGYTRTQCKRDGKCR